MEVDGNLKESKGRIGAPFWSVMSFWWLKELFLVGCQRQLELEDLPPPLPEDRSNVLTNRLQRNWRRENESNRKNPLIRAIFWTFRKEYAALGLITVFNDFVVRLINPLLLQIVLRYFRGDTKEDHHESAFRDALYSSMGIIVLSLAGVVSYNHITYMGCHNGGKLRTAVCGLIYRKTLRLSKASGKEVSPGHVINLMSNDISRFDMVSVFLNWIWSAPLLTLTIAWILYHRIGWPPLVGIGIILIVTPLQCHLGIMSSRIQLKTALEMDERLRLVTELIAGIRMIKMYAWENWFLRRILSVRERELKTIRHSALLRGIYMTMSLFVVRLMILSTILALATSSLTHNGLTTANVFMVSAYYTIIGHSMGQMFVRGITEVAGVTVSLNRIEKYLEVKEPQESVKKTQSDASIEIIQASCYWNKQIRLVDSKTMLLYRNNPPALKDVILKCDKENRLIGIVGPVGSGKTSLLELIMGELAVEPGGSVSVIGSVSFSPQESWLFNGSIRDNIVYDEPWDEQRYDTVIEKCALREDLKPFPHSDQTIIVGERAAALSGGQKARVNLARAVYRQADIYLLDDPLSAVDCQVGRYLFDDIIGPGGFLKDSIRLLVTHQLEYLKHVDWIVVLNGGSIEIQGRPEDILPEIGNFGKYDLKPVTQAESDFEKELKESPKKTLEPIVEQSGWTVVQYYLKYGGKPVVIASICALFVFTQLVCSMADGFVAYLVQWETVSRSLNETLPSTIVGDKEEMENTGIARTTLLLIGGSLLLMILILGIVRTHVFQCNAIRTSARINAEMLNGILQTPIRFFDTNPSGRILNKFSKDLGAMDVQLPKLMLDALQMLLTICGALIVIVIVNPLFLVPLLLLILLFKGVRRIYLKTSKPLKRLDGITKSPVFTHVSSTLSGLSVIRSSKSQERMIREFDEIQDLHTASWFTFQSATIAFCQVLDLFAVIFIAIIIFSFLFFPTVIDDSKIGLAITQSMMMCGLLSWGMRQSAAVSNAFVSVERVLEYISLPKEEQKVAGIMINPSWPNTGRIEFINMSYRYDNQVVLEDINLLIENGQRVGIVGRTGAGKSSLINALFRLSPLEGSILIDGVDTKAIPLEILRQKLSIIPQDPILFHGTIRSNLDPNFEFPNDVEIVKALKDVEMSQLPLNFPIQEGGNNLSVGQKQLVCLARAILRQNRILILDEATANVDPHTDALIQKTIREKFKHCTVLTVAHRLNTVMDSDMIVVIDQGRIYDLGPPTIISSKLPKLAIS